MNKNKNIFLLAVSIAALLAACFSPWRGEAVITLYLGTGANRAVAYPPDNAMKNNLVHKIQLSGPEGVQTLEFKKGALTAQITVVPGRLDITVQAFLDGALYAEGSVSVDAIAGQNNPVNIQMRYAGVTYYTVTFNSNGGNYIESQEVGEGGRAVPPENPTKAGYYFAGWYTDLEKPDEYDFDTPVTEDFTLYAQWDIIQYTVTYNSNNATSGTAPAVQTVNAGSSVTLPDGGLFSRTDYTFGGWNTSADGTETNYSAGSSYTPSGNITLYAKWEPITIVPGNTLAAKLSWLQSNALSGVDYTVEVNADESIAPHTLSYSGRRGIGITMRGVDSKRTVGLSSNGSMFNVGSGVTLILDNNITLQGRSDNTDSLVYVNSGGTLVMNDGSNITGNTSSGFGVGVSVNSGTFTMSGGEISGNTSSFGSGGGVYVINNGTFTMSGGEITGNTASDSGGVYVSYNGTFTMSGGEISGNTADYGGGVSVNSGTFTMSGGEISGNTAIAAFNSLGLGGGVFVYGGTFTKTGGTIYGYSAGDTVNSNVVRDRSGTVQNNRGHAVYAYIDSSRNKRKETTAGPTVNLSFDGTTDPPTFSGAWDN